MNKEVVTDAQRMDWLDSQRRGGKWFVHTGDYGITAQTARHAIAPGHKTIREAIDAAIAKDS